MQHIYKSAECGCGSNPRTAPNPHTHGHGVVSCCQPAASGHAHVCDVSAFLDVEQHRTDLTTYQDSVAVRRGAHDREVIRQEPKRFVSSEITRFGVSIQSEGFHCGTGETHDTHNSQSIDPKLKIHDTDGPVVAQVKFAVLRNQMRQQSGSTANLEVLKPHVNPSSGTPDHITLSIPPPTQDTPEGVLKPSVPVSNWEGPTIAHAPNITHTLMGPHSMDPIFNWVYESLHAAFWVIVFVRNQDSRRVRMQWWCGAAPAAGDTLGPYSDERLEALMWMFGVALARLHGGGFMTYVYDDLTIVQTMTSCQPYTFDCRVDVDASQFRFCADFWSGMTPADEERRQDAIVAALITEPALNARAISTNVGDPRPTGIADAYEVAAWVRRRYVNELHIADPVISGRPGYWDTRPMLTYTPQWDLVRSYTTFPQGQQNHTQLREAWDISWRWVETAMRFLLRLSILAKEPGGSVKVRDMWRYGLGAVLSNSGHNCTTRASCTGDEYCEEGYFTTASDYDSKVSMEDYFGPFTRHRLVEVARTVWVLGLRYHGNHPFLHTKFEVNPAMKNIAPAWSEPLTGGDIVLAELFFKDANRQLRHETIPHEMLHFLLEEYGSGKPHDWWECGGGDLWKCYNFEGAMELVAKDPDKAISNVDNYIEWMRNRYRRWGSAAWPPRADAPLDPWWEDPISDDAHHHLGVLTMEMAELWFTGFVSDMEQWD
jgi:hypothetical protein